MSGAAAATPAQETPKPGEGAAAVAGAAAAGGDAGKGAESKGAPAAGKTDDAGKGTEGAAGAAAAGAAQGKETPGKAGETPKAPDKYALTVPDNGQAYVDEAVLAQVEKMARAAGWSNDDAQAQLNDHIETMRALSATYLTETTADKSYGGDKLDETKKFARLAIAKIRPEGHPYRDPFLKFLNRFAGENNINVVAFLADVGRLFAEDSPGIGKQPTGGPRSAEDVMYPTTAGKS